MTKTEILNMGQDCFLTRVMILTLFGGFDRLINLCVGILRHGFRHYRGFSKEEFGMIGPKKGRIWHGRPKKVAVNGAKEAFIIAAFPARAAPPDSGAKTP